MQLALGLIVRLLWAHWSQGREEAGEGPGLRTLGVTVSTLRPSVWTQ